MNRDGADAASLEASLLALREEVRALGERLARVEAALVKPAPESASPPTDLVSQEIAMVISAAVAAYLGLKPRIRQIRVIGNTPWAQQGRATIQASHNLPMRHR